MPNLEQARNFFYEAFSNTQGKFNQNEFLGHVVDWIQRNMKPEEVFPKLNIDHNEREQLYHEGYVDGYAAATEPEDPDS